MILIGFRRRCVNPYDAGHNLNEGTQKNQEELQVKSPPFALKAGGDLGLEHQQDSVGFDQNTGDAKHKTDAERGLPQPAGPILRLPNEEEGTGEATQEGEEQEIGELAVCRLNDGRVAEFDEDAQHERR